MRRSLGEVLGAGAEDNPLNLTDGVVTEVKANGTVGLSVDGAEDIEAVCLVSYDPRSVGDVVAVLKQDRRMVVIGCIQARTED